MIIPVRCVTCNKVISDKWEWFNEQLAASAPRDARGDPGDPGLGDDALDRDSPVAARKRELMDALGLVRYCCRRHFMGQVDLLDKL
jgi:DNA-directed RNA polymerase I, II, and III subunit RPABC5